MPVAAADLLIMVVHLALAVLAAEVRVQLLLVQLVQEQQTLGAVEVAHNQSLVDLVDLG
jgi:hypothetical protein